MFKPRPVCYAFVWLLFVAQLTSCDSCSRRRLVPAPLSDTETRESASEKLTVDVFLDATVSMQGFVNPGPWTRYAQTLQLLEGAVQTTWPRGEVRFFKFGTKTARLTGAAHLQARTPAFYVDPGYCEETKIEDVVDSANVTHMAVIVTDLFQKDSDVNLLTRDLNDEYIGKRLAVAVLGIKSEFDGTVYDVGINRYKFQWPPVGHQAPAMRPFYVLLLGKHADIERYFSSLRSDQPGFVRDENFMIFSRHLVDRPPSFRQATVDSTRDFDEITSILSHGSKRDLVKQFRVRGRRELSSCVVTLEYHQLPFTMPFDASQLSAEVLSEQLHEDVFVSMDVGGGPLSITRAILSGSKLSLRAELATSSLPEEGIYRFEVTLRPRKEAYRMPSWFSEWDMDVDSIEQWHRYPDRFEGETTLNLQPFLNNLWRTTEEEHQPAIAKLYYYIKKE